MKKVFIAEFDTCEMAFQGDLLKSKLYALSNINAIEITNSIEEADLIIFNANCACTIDSIKYSVGYFTALLGMKKENAKTILTGCMARNFKCNCEYLSNLNNWLKENFDYIYNANDYLKILYDFFPGIDFGNAFGAATIEEPEVADIYVSNGCNNLCTFCKATFMQFSLKSMDFDTFKHYVDLAVSNGAKTIRINGTNIAQLGLDNVGKTMLPEFIEYAHQKNEIEEISLAGLAFKDAIEHNLDDVIREYKKIININGSIESGSNKLLKLMNKGITSEEVIEFMDRIRQRHYVHLYTNIISGFPTESEEDVNKTIALLSYVRPKKVVVSNYVDSPFVASHNLPQLTQEEINSHTDIYKSELRRLRILARYQ